jgi:glycosyltransferase involved in cell wall biosynthesis
MSGDLKKVLYVITKSNFGGAQRYVYDLASNLPDTYEAVVTFGGTGDPGSGAGKLEELLERAGIRTIFIKNFSYNIRFFKEFFALFELITIFRKERPDIIHLNSSKAGGLGALAGRIAGVPMIVYISHGWAFNEPVSLLSKSFRWLASLMTIILSHRVIAISHFEKKHVPLGLPATVIHNGVAIFETHTVDEAKEEVEKRFGIPQQARIIGSIAELNPSKALENLIYATQSLREGHILVMGEGASRTELETLIKRLDLEDRVHLVGFVDGARSLLKAFDIFVLPSRKEGFPYTLLEAGVATIPVVATTVGGVPEIIEDNRTGLLVPPDDPAALAQAIRHIADQPELQDRLRKNLRDKVEREFTLDEMVKKTIAVYSAY